MNIDLISNAEVRNFVKSFESISSVRLADGGCDVFLDTSFITPNMIKNLYNNKYFTLIEAVASYRYEIVIIISFRY